MRHVGFATSIIAKFCALRDGLVLASQLGITHLAVELDHKVIIDIVLSKISSNKSYSSPLNNCKYLLGQFQQVKINHVYQEANRGGKNLAKGDCSLVADFIVLDVPLIVELCVILNSNAYGLYSLRLLATTLPFVAS